jgi:hypothetical protein
MSQRKLLRIYDSVLSEVAPRIFVGADESARDLAKLREAGITHVVNCAAGTCANYFEDTGGGHHHTEGQPSAGACCEDGPPLSYLSLYLQDSLREDISRAFYDSIEFIDDAVQSGGSVLIHCQHGVSRSATIAMAHLMWRDAVGYEEALDRVRSIRPTVNPNIGFACALLAWQGATLAPPAEALAWELCRVTGELRPLSYEPGLGGRELLEAVKKVPAEAAAVGQPHAGGGNENGKEGGHGHADEGSGVHPHPNGVGGNGGCTPEGERLLVFQRGPGAACWVEGGSGGAIAPAAALSEAEARLRRFHRLPPNVKIRVLCAGSEDASFWQLLGGEPCAGGAAGPSRTGTPPRCTRRDPPPGCVPETLGSARSVTSGDDLLRNESGCTAPSAHPSAEALRRVQPPPAHQSPQALRRMQMQAAALQHILVEISLALPTSSSCAGSCAGSPPGSLSSSLPGSLPGSCSGSVRGATPLAARSSDLTPYEMNELLDLPTAPFIGHNTDRVLPSLSQLGKLQDGRLSAIARLSASQDLLAQPVLPEESGEVRAALAWLLEELLPELAGTYLAPLGGELHEFGRGLAPTDGGAHEPAAEVGGIEGEDLLAAEERLVARIHQARDEAEADCEAAFAAAEAAHA